MRWRLYAILVVCSVLPLLLFLYAADRVMRRTTTNNLLAQTGPAAETAVSVFTDRMSDARETLTDFAADPALLDAWNRSDGPRLAAMLHLAHELRHRVSYFAIYDSGGHLRLRYPEAPADSAPQSSPWLDAALHSDKAAVSGLTLIARDQAGIVVAAPMGTPSARGIVCAIYDADSIKRWTNDIAPSAMRWITVVDQNGVILTGVDLGASGTFRNVSSRLEVNQVLAGKNGTEFLPLPGGEALVTRRPLATLGWGVLVEIPKREIDKAIWQFEQPIAIVGLIFVGLALAFGVVIATLYRRLRESREHVRRIVTAAIDAFVACDQRGVVTDWNAKAEQLFGWTATEAIGKPLLEMIVPEPHRDAFRRGLLDMANSRGSELLDRRLELPALRRNGREFLVELSLTRVQSGGAVSFNAFLHDITKRKEEQAQIRTLNAELKDRVSELEERNKALEAFNYSVSHDVRGPLRNIAGFSDLMLEEYSGALPPAAQDYLQRIQTNVVRMQRLVDDLLRFARLGVQCLHLEVTDLNELVREVIASLESERAGREVSFEVALLPTIECDRGLVRQVFWNLLANALKFTRKRSLAIVSVGMSPHDGEDVFFVRDNGVGFDMKQADKLFGAFQRLHRFDEFEGTGIGLAAVHRIVSKHQGRIWAEAEVNHGATFYFTLRSRDAAGGVPQDTRTTATALR